MRLEIPFSLFSSLNNQMGGDIAILESFFVRHVWTYNDGEYIAGVDLRGMARLWAFRESIPYFEEKYNPTQHVVARETKGQACMILWRYGCRLGEI